MKLLIKNGFAILVLILIIASCKKDKEILFNQPDAIYVSQFDENGIPIPDSTEYSFATSPTTRIADTIFINYRIIGNSANIDRQINLLPRSGATAKAEYHYKLGPAIVKAGAFGAIVPVYLYRKPGLKDSIVEVILDIKDNENFKQGYTPNLRYKITFTDILKKPAIWDRSWQLYFGEYSEVKFRFLISATGKTNWNSSPLPQDSRYLSQRARNALLEYNQSYGPLIDENGAQVFFP